MTPTLIGRIQTRLFLLATVGVGWTIVAVPLIPRFGASLRTGYRAAFVALLLVGLFGIGWDSLYHAIQQYRWEKDWPILLGLATGLTEFLWTYLFLASLLDGPNAATAFLHFQSTWLVMWLAANGPLRVVFLRWRYQGGRIL